jgi:hypothetical protein
MLGDGLTLANHAVGHPEGFKSIGAARPFPPRDRQAAGRRRS